MQNKMNQQLKWLVDKYLNRTATDAEAAIVEDFFATFSDREDVLDQFDNIERKEVKLRIQREIARRIRKKQTPIILIRRFSSKIAVAAVCVLVAAFAMYIYSSKYAGTELSAKNGEQRQIVLTDGTRVTLNGSSTLRYRSSFGTGDTREVTLTGEAYFDVAKNPEKPFLIHTDRMEIRVLGTAFNVRDYKDEETAETSLIHGKVQIHKVGNEENTFFLKPKEKFVLEPAQLNRQTQRTAVENTSHTVNVKPITVSDHDGGAVETEWMYRRITIQEESLQQIARRLERMYGLEIHISNLQKAAQTYSATFDNEQIDDVLKALQAVVPFSYRKSSAGTVEIY